jgi:ankyrin repeat protein
MNAARARADARRSNEVVELMSLETMFPDPRVRALARAAGNGRLDEVDRLLSEGVDVNARGTKGVTPLVWAMHDISGFTGLLERGADPNVRFGDAGSVMHWAASAADPRLLKAALKHGGNPNLKAGPWQETPIFDALGPSIGSIEILLNAGADIDATTEMGVTPVVSAAGIGHYEETYLLLQRGADYSIRDKRDLGLVDAIARTAPRIIRTSDGGRAMLQVVAFLRERGVEVPESAIEPP